MIERAANRQQGDQGHRPARQREMLFVKDLGSRYDAVATWKDRILIFIPVGSTTTASGKKLEAVTLTKRDGSRPA